MLVDLRIIGGPDAIHTAGNGAILTNKLRQISAGFVFVDQDSTRYTRLNEAKTEALGEILDGTGDNVLAFYQFTPERESVLERIDGAVPIDEPGAIKAWDRGEIRCLVAHPASAGYGLNLQHGGSTQAWLSLPWSLEEWQQGVDRTHRQGQRQDVVAHWMNASPVDEVVMGALDSKEDVQETLLRYLKERHLFL